jgi:hypothetical protein
LGTATTVAETPQIGAKSRLICRLIAVVALTTSASDTEALRDARPIWNGSPKSIKAMPPLSFIVLTTL